MVSGGREQVFVWGGGECTQRLPPPNLTAADMPREVHTSSCLPKASQPSLPSSLRLVYTTGDPESPPLSSFLAPPNLRMRHRSGVIQI